MSKPPMVIRRYVLERRGEMEVEAALEWRPLAAAPLGVEKVAVWALEERFPHRRGTHALVLVGGIGGDADVPETLALNGHLATWTEEPFTWHLFTSTKSPKVTK